MSRKVWLAGLVAALLVFPGIGLAAVVLDLTDSSSGQGEGTVYHLEIGSTSGFLTADVISNPGWGIGWWSLKLDATGWESTGSPSTGGTWAAATGAPGGGPVDLIGANNWPQNQRNGIYVNGVLVGGDKSGLALLNGTSTYRWEFGFTSADLDGLEFQVGYFSPNSPATPRLSQAFQVPEPPSLLLLGAGLIGIAGYGRKKFKK